MFDDLFFFFFFKQNTAYGVRISDWSSDVCSSDLWPAIEAEKLVPAYCGIRPKIASESGNADFIISGPAEHGLEGLINLFGIESPGLTASLAIARRVGEMVR